MIATQAVQRSYGRLWVAVLLVTPLVTWAATPDDVPAEKRAATEAKTVESVREALQREVYGLTADREQLLRQASEADPESPLPHWYLGQVRSADGKWQAVDAQPTSREAQLTREYQALRATKKDDANGNRQLADWCLKHSLKQQERAHLNRLLDLGSTQTEVRTRLGMVRVNDQWFDKEALAREQQRQTALRELHTRWLPNITQLAAQVTSPDTKKRTAAVDEVLAIRDAGLLSLLQSVFAPRGEEHQLLVLKVCERISDPTATDLIARQAVLSPSPKIREAAMALLKDRDQAAFVPLLISAMYSPVELRVSSVLLPNGAIATRRAFWREGAQQHEVVVSDQIVTGTRIGRSSPGTQADLRDQMFRTVETRQAQAERNVAAENALNAQRNQRIGEVLSAATGEQLGVDAAAWWKWWSELNDAPLSQKGVVSNYSREVNRLVSRDVPVVSISPTATPTSWSVTRRYDCFAAGTPIWTDQGPTSIENLRIGDLVLARDVETGELAYKPVMRTMIRPKHELKLVTVGDDVFECTPGHLFWVSGEGWVRARDLQSGKILHTATGPVTVTNVDDGRAAETHNLRVADFGTFFVGQQKILSHDVTTRQPTRAVVPGLQPE
ncbi:polymorphic toxin-type HINT domain-containing protein [Anatilimnocola sp. NA78]|uniref:polymorphic toxin-type HINT domain-containing protein n=1 Tax=Anatilimnocola sp. NA78 TaxID=3415683 RepID=UPI003CE56B03